MSKEETLKKIEMEIESGNLGKARDRLQGLLSTYPDDLAIRRKLGDVYSLIKLPETAGRYWYLVESKSDEMEKAVSVYESRFGNDPTWLLMTLKYRGDIHEQADDYARNKILSLQKESKRKYGSFPDYRLRGLERWHKKGDQNDNFGIGGVLVIVLLLIIFLTGLITIVYWNFIFIKNL